MNTYQELEDDNLAVFDLQPQVAKILIYSYWAWKLIELETCNLVGSQVPLHLGMMGHSGRRILAGWSTL